ncbi:MAG: YceI family protein [Pirellulaceae bacterium]
MIRAGVTLACSLVVVFTSGLAQAQAPSFKLDPTHTSIIFGISHLGYSYTYGRFNVIDGEFTLDGESSTFSFSMDANSIDTGNEKRDEHLRGVDFFNVNQFPKMEFKSTKVELTDDGMNVTGNMTMHGETAEIVIPFKLLKEGDTPFGDYRAGFSTQFNLKRSEFGMTNMLQGIGDDVAITFSFEGVRQ